MDFSRWWAPIVHKSGVKKKKFAATCVNIYSRLCGNGAKGRRSFKNVIVLQPLKAGILGLRNLNHQAVSLKEAPSPRFIREDTPAKQNVFYHFGSELLPV